MVCVYAIGRSMVRIVSRTSTPFSWHASRVESEDGDGRRRQPLVKIIVIITLLAFAGPVVIGMVLSITR